MPTPPSEPGSGPPRWGPLRWGLLTVVVAQFVVLYAPSAPSVGPVTWTDKVVHALVFAFPAALIVLSSVRPWWLLALALHAPVSELVQHVLLPNRSGDPADVLADLAGVALGVGVGVFCRRLRRW